jgi:hypothetical protein
MQVSLAACNGCSELPRPFPIIACDAGFAAPLRLLQSEAIEERLHGAVRVDSGEHDPGRVFGRAAATLGWWSGAGRDRRHGRAAGSNPFLLTERHLWRGQADYIALSLGQLNRCEDRPETFVLHDLAWVDVRILVEGRVGKLPPVAVDLDPTVLPLANADFSSSEAESLRGGRDEIRDSPEVHHQVARQRALFVPGEDLVEVLITDGPVGIVRVARNSAEATVEILHERGGERIALLHAAHARRPRR